VSTTPTMAAIRPPMGPRLPVMLLALLPPATTTNRN